MDNSKSVRLKAETWERRLNTLGDSCDHNLDIYTGLKSKTTLFCMNLGLILAINHQNISKNA